MNFGSQTASNSTCIITHSIYIPHSTSLPGFADRDQQTEVNHTLSNGQQQATLIMCRRKVGVIPPEKNWGPKNDICSVFRWLQHLMANMCWTKRDTDNRVRALESAKGLLHCRKISRTLVHKRLKTEPEVLPTLTILFCHCPLHIYAALTWRPTATLDEMVLGSFAAKIWSLKRC